MTGTNLKDQIEKILRDTSNTYWTEAQILDYINEAQKDFARSSLVFEKRFTLTVNDASKGLYNYPTDLIWVKRIFSATAQIRSATTKQLDIIDQDWEAYPQGTVDYYYVDGLGLSVIGLYPKP